MNSSTRISPIPAGLRFVVSMVRLALICSGDRRDRFPTPRLGHCSIERSTAIAHSPASNESRPACAAASRSGCRAAPASPDLVAASSIISQLPEQPALEVSWDVSRPRHSSTKKARSHSSRKLTIIQPDLGPHPYVPLYGTGCKRRGLLPPFFRPPPPVLTSSQLRSTLCRHLDQGPKGRAERSSFNDRPSLVEARSLHSALRAPVETTEGLHCQTVADHDPARPAYQCSTLDLDVVLLDHLGPALGLELQLLEIRLGRAAGGDVAEIGELLLHGLGILDDLRQQAVEALDDRAAARRPARRGRRTPRSTMSGMPSSTTVGTSGRSASARARRRRCRSGGPAARGCRSASRRR